MKNGNGVNTLEFRISFSICHPNSDHLFPDDDPFRMPNIVFLSGTHHNPEGIKGPLIQSFSNMGLRDHLKKPRQGHIGFCLFLVSKLGFATL